MGINRGYRAFVGAMIVAGTLSASAASADASTRVYVRIGPPAPIVETRVVAPGPGYVWVGGYHTWAGRQIRLGAGPLESSAARARRLGRAALGARPPWLLHGAWTLALRLRV